ncbi:MAG: hypothetical protein MUC83_18005 [Pirellula sp.]|jgi:hypothetical protein|nr:hypothetical protein [Pirellula sp.]
MRKSATMICSLLGFIYAMVGFGVAKSPIFAPDSPWANYGFVTDDYDTRIDAELGFISLYRSQPDSNPFVFALPSTTLLNMDQLAGSGGTGFDGLLTIKRIAGNSQPIDLQTRFFESRGMTSLNLIEFTPVVIPVFYNGIPIDPAQSYLIEYETDLQSAELNLRTQILPRLHAVAGLRYFEIAERFDIVNSAVSSPTQRFGFFSSNENDAIGGQLGLEGVLISRGFGRLTGGVKWAYLSNSVEGIATASDTSGSPLTTILNDTETTHLIDVQLGATFSVTHWLGLYAGYQGIFGSDFALAPTQSRRSQIVLPTNPVIFESTHWHGYRIGAALTW